MKQLPFLRTFLKTIKLKNRATTKILKLYMTYDNFWLSTGPTIDSISSSETKLFFLSISTGIYNLRPLNKFFDISYSIINNFTELPNLGINVSNINSTMFIEENDIVFTSAKYSNIHFIVI